MTKVRTTTVSTMIVALGVGSTVCAMIAALAISLIVIGIAQSQTVFSIPTERFSSASQVPLSSGENGEQARVYSLALPVPGETLNYERVLAQKEALELSTPQTTVVLATH